ncbi:CD2-associated protein isoform X1 [Lutzomyia longipalpis]|uniref:CD2-associated protein isoform X1 n=1 Tax=Lutzomyia longipalpis TaxID=7200 RepID=UPI002483385B|nr:CD2-associated protein isoform X1 [Lutzomyia longipalpis]
MCLVEQKLWLLGGFCTRRKNCASVTQKLHFLAPENLLNFRHFQHISGHILHPQSMDSSATRSSVSAIVEHEYTAMQPDELSLVKGAIIQNIKVQPGGWWEGTLASSGKTGMFPDNFVRVLEPDDKNPVVLRDKSATSNRRCKVVYSYTQNNNDELSLAVGDVIEVLGEVEEGWWRGKLNNRVGVFPSNFVLSIDDVSPVSANRISTNISGNRTKTSLNSSREDLVSAGVNNSIAQVDKDAPSLPPKPVRETCKVLYPYEPMNEDELELLEGDIITILSKDLPDKGWWKGELRGKMGVFPDNFVSLLPPEASPSKENPNKPDRPPPASKMIIQKTTNSNSTNSTRKDSFGSKDSLNETGIVSGIVTGNVAAHRKSLESKSVDPIAEKPPRKSFETKSSGDIRKSLENLDEKKATPPPVLSKKPSVPIKKSPTIGSVTGNLFSGLKQKVKPAATESKVTNLDNPDGGATSKMGSPQVADNSEKGVVGERISRSFGESDFDQVERSSGVLKDMRANRAKLPKGRRPPSSALNSSGESSLLNGSSGSIDEHNNSKDTSQSEDELVKPKAREWEKNRAPWMAELKANQAKKTSPSFDTTKSPEAPQTRTTTESVVATVSTDNHHMEKSDMSKSFSSSFMSSSQSTSSSQRKTNETFEVRSNSVDVKSSSASFDVTKKESSDAMTKSVSAMSTKISISDSTAQHTAVAEEVIPKPRPVSVGVNLRNRSNSPMRQISAGRPPSVGGETALNAIISQGHEGQQQSEGKVHELEQRVAKLERIVQSQGSAIEDLVRRLRDETDKVRTLKAELEKYAQCVTQYLPFI